MNTGAKSFDFSALDGTRIFCRSWKHVSGKPKGVVQVAHGAAEHSGRYDRFARFLDANGYLVYANDRRGHGDTRVRSGALGDAGPHAWNRMVAEARELTVLIERAHPGLPIALFGHSMGSFLAQDYMARYGRAVAGVVLCATNGVFNPFQSAGRGARGFRPSGAAGSTRTLQDVFRSLGQVQPRVHTRQGRVRLAEPRFRRGAKVYR